MIQQHSNTQIELTENTMICKKTCNVLENPIWKKYQSWVSSHKPFISLENKEYYRVRRLLNKEQQTIVKDIALKYTCLCTCSLQGGKEHVRH
jgi:hypothetical protein